MPLIKGQGFSPAFTLRCERERERARKVRFKDFCKDGKKRKEKRGL